jgi:hypothetical protein
MPAEPVRYLSAESMTADDFGIPFTMAEGEIVYDAMTKRPDGRGGPWATMTEASFRVHGMGRVGLGIGQKYQRQANGQLHKIAG